MKIKILPVLLVLLLLSSHAPLAFSQQASSNDWAVVQQIRTNEKLVVKQQNGKEVKGSMIEANETSLTIDRDGKPLSIPRPNVRVHEDFLAGQKLPYKIKSKDLWEQRFEDICNFERYLTHNGIVILKFFLHVSKKEQQQRFLARIDDPAKNWKFSLNDVHEREHWDEYMHAYEETVRNTASKYAPWYVVPADHKWFTRLVVASAIVERLSELDLEYPSLGKDDLRALEDAKKVLLASE